MAYNMNAARCSQQYRYLANICTKEPLSSACTQRHGEAKRERGKVSVRNGISSAKAKEKLLRKKKKRTTFSSLRGFILYRQFHNKEALSPVNAVRNVPFGPCKAFSTLCSASSFCFISTCCAESLLELLFLQGFKQTEHCHFDVVLMPGKKK